MPPTPNKIWDNNKTQQISVTAQVFFVKTELEHIQLQLLVNYFILLLLIFCLKSLTHRKINRIGIFLTWNRQLIRDWHKINQENMIHIYDVIIIDVTGFNNFQFFHLGKITRNYYMPVTCYHVI